MPSVVLKNAIMGSLHRPTNDSAIADSIDFISDMVIVITDIIVSILTKQIQCVTLTFAERNRLALSRSGNNPPSAN